MPRRPTAARARARYFCSMDWNPNDMPSQRARTAVVTGSNSGIGFHAAAHLARAGAHVVLACRNDAKATAARARILAECPTASVAVSLLDLTDLSSIRAFADRTRTDHKTVDLLINNAGVMIPPYGMTSDGFELQFGTNHLGHFALTGLLLPSLMNAKDGRIVTVSSNAHRFGRINFKDPNHRRRYIRWEAYGQSKLANLLFAFELNRRLRAQGASLTSTAAHPGFASTNIVRESVWMPTVSPLFGQSSDAGSWPTLRAATDPAADGGSYWGPKWFFQLWGPPVRVRTTRAATDEAAARRLWALSEELTGVEYLTDSDGESFAPEHP